MAKRRSHRPVLRRTPWRCWRSHDRPGRRSQERRRGSVVVAASRAANAEGIPPVAASTLTRRRTRSAASSGSRSDLFRPSGSRSPRSGPQQAGILEALAKGVQTVADPRAIYWREAHHRHAGCCARAASGQAAAVPSSVMNSRRLIRSPRRHARAASARSSGRGLSPPSG